MFGLGVLYAERLDPPDLDAARRWFEQAAAAGQPDAMNNLGVLYADRLHPPDLAALLLSTETTENDDPLA
jgi:TPR repeat protein